MIYLFLLAFCIAFIELFMALDIKREGVNLIARSRDAMAVIASSELDDDEKESFMRRTSVEMFKATIRFIIKFLLIIMVLFVMYWLTIFAFPELRAPILQYFVSPVGIVGMTLIAIAYVWIRNVTLK